MVNSADVGLHNALRQLLYAALAGVVLASVPGSSAAAGTDDSWTATGFGLGVNGVSTGLGLKVASADEESAPAATAGGGSQSAFTRYFNEWFVRSDAAKESQPHWMTPVVTVTPRLEQEYRYDQLWQYKANGSYVQNYGFNKGLELIPTEQTEVIIAVPGYVKETNAKGNVTEGWADESLLLKIRMLSENEEHGNYIVTGFIGASIPTGTTALGSPWANNQTIWTPTIAGGKGWGTRESGFDIQSTLSISYGDVNQTALGQPIVWNTTFQAHIFDKLWPAIEVNYTHYEQGENAGKSQTVITTELILGRYELIDRVKFVLGVAYEQPVSEFRTFGYAWIFTARAPF